MNCVCGKKFKCIDSRDAPNGRRRSYSCVCGNRISTIEIAVDVIGPGKSNFNKAKDSMFAEYKEQIKREVISLISTI